MLMVLKILLTIGVTALMLLLLCLFIPFTYKLGLTGSASGIKFRIVCRIPGIRISFAWESGVYHFRLCIFNHPMARRAPGQPSPSPRTMAGGRQHSFSLGKALLNAALRQRGLTFLTGVWRVIKPRHFSVNARIGFSEPHYTGWMMAAAALLQAGNPAYAIHIDASWVEPCLEGEIQAAGKFMPALILWQILRFLASPEIRAYYRKNARPHPARAIYTG